MAPTRDHLFSYKGAAASVRAEVTELRLMAGHLFRPQVFTATGRADPLLSLNNDQKGGRNSQLLSGLLV